MLYRPKLCWLAAAPQDNVKESRQVIQVRGLWVSFAALSMFSTFGGISAKQALVIWKEPAGNLQGVKRNALCRIDSAACERPCYNRLCET